MKLRKEIYKIGFWVLIVVILGFVGNIYFTINRIPEINLSRVFLSMMVVSVGLLTFFGFVGLGVKEGDTNLSKTEVRLAIVISVMTMYLVIVGTVSFFAQGGELPVITDTMITHFTTIVGVVVAFYFGTAAYEAVHKSSSNADEDNVKGKNKDGDKKK